METEFYSQVTAQLLTVSGKISIFRVSENYPEEVVIWDPTSMGKRFMGVLARETVCECLISEY